MSRMKQKVKWIAVAEETPNYHFEVIVCGKHGETTSGWYVPCNGCVSGGKFIDWDNECIKNILYWMPMPNPPK